MAADLSVNSLLVDLEPPDRELKKIKDPIKLILRFVYVSIIFWPSIWYAIFEYFLLSPYKSIKGRNVLVTGAGRGLGRHLAMCFAKEGCKVACVDTDVNGNNETVNLVNQLYHESAKAYTADVASASDVATLGQQVIADFEKVDILVNNAGIVYAAPILEPEGKYEKVIEVNLLAHFKMIRQFLPAMQERNSGHIVAISSIASLIGSEYGTAYCASKWGVTGLMESLNAELNRNPSNKIRISTVCPYFINTSASYIKPWNLAFPALTPVDTAESIVNGIKKNQTLFSVPGYIYWLLILAKLLPANLQQKIKSIVFSSKDAELGGLEKKTS